MSDLDVMREMLTRAGLLEADEAVGVEGSGAERELPDVYSEGGEHRVLRCKADGYCSFYAEMYFREDGSLMRVAAWE